MDEPAETTLVELTDEENLALLGACDVGRVGVVHDGDPVIFPVNYRLIAVDGTPAIAIRTRPDNSIDHPGERVAFQIDGIDAGHDTGWSVLVRGRMLRIAAHHHIDPRPFLAEGRSAWRLIVPDAITGRRLVPAPGHWPIQPEGYL